MTDIAPASQPQLSSEDEDEKFNFVGGMGELLTAVATFILFVGLSFLLFGVDAVGGISRFVYGNFIMLIGLALVMSEYITRHKKLTGPSIVLAVVFASLVAMMVGYFDIDRSVEVSGVKLLDHFERSVIYAEKGHTLTLMLILTAHIAYYWRYKTPFMMLLIAAGSAHWLFLHLAGNVSWLLQMLYASAVIALGIWYDQQDVQRVSRKSDCAFWLHLAGAIIFMQALSVPLDLGQDPTAGAAIMFLLLYMGLTLLAIVINRRALISTGLIFAGVAVYQLLERVGGMDMSITALTLVVIGTMVLALSLWWKGIRAAVMRFMPESLNRSFPVGHGF